MRIDARRRGGFDDNAVERACNKGIIPKYWLHADDLLPPARSVPRSVGRLVLENRDWGWLLEVWQDKPEGPERNAMLVECRRRLGLRQV